MKLAVVLLAGLVTLAGVAADYTVKCEKFSGLPGGYCVHTPVANPSPDVLYHLHGNGSSEWTWQDDAYYPAQIRTQWKSTGSRLPLVLSVSFGPTWLLAEKNSSANGGLFETFTRKIMPKLESAIGGVKGRRLVVGESMGGFNATQLALKTDLFRKAAILCAPMSEVSPFASPSEIEAFTKKSTAWAYHKNSDPTLVSASVAQLIQLAKGFFPTEGEWAQADPLRLAASAGTAAPAVYLAAGFYDRYAILEGNEKFARILGSRGVAVDWRPQWGGHCAMDIPSLASFLVE